MTEDLLLVLKRIAYALELPHASEQHETCQRCGCMLVVSWVEECPVCGLVMKAKEHTDG